MTAFCLAVVETACLHTTSRDLHTCMPRSGDHLCRALKLFNSAAADLGICKPAGMLKF